mgnify:CR=1 FL=1
MNPYKLRNDPDEDSKDNLAFRAPLGAELELDRNIGSNNYASYHPAITGSAITNSCAGDSNYIYSTAAPTYLAQTQSIYYNQPYVGIRNRISDKIK